MTGTVNDLRTKSDFRNRALELRNALQNKDQLSEEIRKRLVSLPEYQSAEKILVYLGVRTEVRTLTLVRQRLQMDLPTFVPYCEGNDLRIFPLTDESQLERGAFGILEPRDELRQSESTCDSISQLDLAVIPGVAFDQRGTRIGYGKGYFDRLLTNTQNSVTKIGLAFECQIFPELPGDEHDIDMNIIVTPTDTIRV